MSYIAALNAFGAMKGLIQTYGHLYEQDVEWTELDHRALLYNVRELVESQFFLGENDTDAMENPHDDPAVASSLQQCCEEILQWVNDQFPTSKGIHAIVPIDDEGTTVIVLYNGKR